MNLPPMAQRVRDWIFAAQQAVLVEAPVPPNDAAVLSWLRGDRPRCETLVNLLNGRVDGRGLLPIPSNPHEVMVNVGRDREARELARLLSSLCTSPVDSGSMDVYERDRGPGGGGVQDSL